MKTNKRRVALVQFHMKTAEIDVLTSLYSNELLVGTPRKSHPRPL